MTETTTRAIAVAKPASGGAARSRRVRRQSDTEDRSILSELDRRRRGMRVGVAVLGGLVIVALIIVCAGPLAWLFKAATSTTAETLSSPFSLWPTGIHWDAFAQVWTRVDFGRYFWNTLALMAGSLFFGVLVAATGGYGLAVLKPRYAKPVFAAVLATLFIPGVISLVPLYLTVIDVPLVHVSLLGTLWAVWLPSSANAVNVLLMQRFFANIPGEIFEAARIDGAGAFRIFVSIVVPMSRPIFGVVSLLTLVASYKEFLWPLLVLPNPQDQPIAVALPRLEGSIDLAQLMAALFISVIIPVILFLIFQRQFLRAAGNAGALKG
ncbi:carbohydrate ABC transporter permease [Leifsonia sp. 21MFCrub1.1]|uniref:carbohydrate ABC transporter permease n=1 Tax=Leifsonia sp. 21MFCrub1.1 TaxID=1798223 RepID=UPI00089285CF|nr:carbohydrate ABC transporter permease [Leifsonia sp. 21MFCrub1.1]SEB09962.1 carbohydrate ABC transporter membrane protein 2, CUT1 family [Leifsonia sp. 21MFCrub1.1]